MSTQQNAGIPEVVKWLLGLAYTVIVLIGGYVVSVEHRLTDTESKQATHLADAKETKADVYNRLKQQDDNISKVLSGITSVQVDVATIKGYMERSKAKE